MMININEEWLSSKLSKKVKILFINKLKDSITEVYNLKITENEKEKNIIIKIENSNPSYSSFAKTLLLYDREINFYNNISKILFQKNNKKYKIPYCYFSDIEENSKNYAIIMEDLNDVGYIQQNNLIDGLNIDDAKKCIIGLANFHKDSINSKKTYENLNIIKMDDNLYKKMIVNSLEQKIGIYIENRKKELQEQEHFYLNDIIKKITKEKVENFLKQASLIENYSLIYHGDFKIENILFNKNDNTIAIIDWQTYTVGNVLTTSIDVSSFICNCLRIEDRKKWENELLLLYYNEFIKNNNKFNDYSFDNFKVNYRFSSLWILIIDILKTSSFSKSVSMEKDEKKKKEMINRQLIHFERISKFVFDSNLHELI
jgi:hypothetical protein